jgi:hypothetical protein
VRPLDVDDLATIWRINEANVPEVGSVSLDRLRYLVGESAIALAADLDGDVVGFCLVLAPGSGYDSSNYRWFAEHRPAAWYLDRVAIDAGRWGVGVGRALYDEVVVRLERRGVGALGLEVNSDPPNDRSLAFHQRQGFVELERRMTPYGIEVAMMERLLDPATS